MNFFRHVYNEDDGQENILSDLSSFGFYDLSTQNPIGDNHYLLNTTYDSTLPPPPLDLYWSKDPLHKVTLHRFYSNSSGNNTKEVEYVFYPSDPLFRPSSAPIYKSGFLTLGDIEYTIDRRYRTKVHSLILIPLKGGGFLFNNKLNFETSGSGLGSYVLPTTFPLMIVGNSKSDYKTVRAYNTRDGNTDIMSSIMIGLPPTNKSALNNYMYLYGLYHWNGNNRVGKRNNISGTDYTNYLAPYFDFQTGTLYEQFFYMYNCNQETKKDNINIMNFTPNVCILTKAPYQSGFIDNLYMMTTCPRSKEQGATIRGDFFSFNGRNFINIFGNMVLELPSY